jgi:polyribonucleotide nucleotidyltransferase
MEENWDDDTTVQKQIYFEPLNNYFNDQQTNKKTNTKFYQNNDNKNRDKYYKKNYKTSEEKCTFFIETSKLGKLIGRGGCQIKELQEKSGSQIIVSKILLNLINR